MASHMSANYQATPAPAASLNPTHIRPKQAALRHGVSLSWFWAAIADGRLSRPKKIGERISLFNVEQLDREFAALMAETPKRVSQGVSHAP